MNTCSNCKWWGLQDENYVADCDKITEESKIFHPDITGDSYVPFQTTSDFGCIHWEKKDE